MKINIQCVNLGPRSMSVVGLSWFNGPSLNRPSLAICYENGKFQIMRNENDDCESIEIRANIWNLLLTIFFLVPIIVDTQIQAVDCSWNHDGTVLAVCGSKTFTDERDSNVVMFYSPFGVVCQK